METRLYKELAAIESSTQPICVDNLAKRFSVSARTIYSDVKRINNFLGRQGEGPLRVVKGVIYNVRGISKEDVCRLQDKVGISYSPLQRRRMLYVQLFLLGDSFGVKDLLACTDVSRNTVMRDLSFIRDELSRTGIELEAQAFQGYKLTGDERTMRNAFIAACSYIDYGFENLLLDNDDRILLQNIQSAFYEFCRNESVRYSNQGSGHIYAAFLVSGHRMRLGYSLGGLKSNSVQVKSERKLSGQIKALIEKVFGCNLELEEVLFLADKIMETSIIDESKEITEDWLSVDLATEAFIKRVSELSSFAPFCDDEELYKGLNNHLIPAFRRARAHEHIDNPLMDLVNDGYSDLNSVVHRASHIFQEMLDVSFDDAELAYLTLFFAASIERLGGGKRLRTRIAIVCDSGISTSEVLRAYLSARFDVQIVGTFSTSEIREWLRHDADVQLIVSTVPIDLPGNKVVVVSPLPSNADNARLKESLGPMRLNARADDVIEIVKRFGIIPSGQFNNLVWELNRYFDPFYIGRQETNRGIDEVLRSDAVEVGYQAKSSEDAVREAGHLLYQAGLCSVEYVDGMVEQLRSVGAYFVVSPGIAIPHARSELGVFDVGFSLVVLEEPISFGHSRNDPVRIVMGLCTPNRRSHLHALAQMVKLLNDHENVEILMKAKEPSQVLEFINQKTG